ncbi:hypothetical protein SAMN05421493_11197 [Pseudobutyrivibrio sp. 49]|uniref:hypothetical protein n=1 Tax=Pseudobutyrivibrio sp. 49 TaxID=1855344 RepID=UPI00088C5E26|nr:hypothetical protein [Pseudobutyrivibrio sp. 49]SDI32144.1 hypothetical protein SAMN05421493_11197 [Pseudobutyrivibrio sp. 49]
MGRPHTGAFDFYMRTKKIFSVALCAMLSFAMFLSFAPTAKADELTQAKDSSQVHYGTVSAED